MVRIISRNLKPGQCLLRSFWENYRSTLFLKFWSRKRYPVVRQFSRSSATCGFVFAKQCFRRWVHRMWNSGVFITEALIVEKVRRPQRSLKLSLPPTEWLTCTFSNRWLHHFKTRHNFWSHKSTRADALDWKIQALSCHSFSQNLWTCSVSWAYQNVSLVQVVPSCACWFCVSNLVSC